MPRTREQLEKALADTEAWLDNLDPKSLASSESDGEDLCAIGEALRTVAASDHPERVAQSVVDVCIADAVLSRAVRYLHDKVTLSSCSVKVSLSRRCGVSPFTETP